MNALINQWKLIGLHLSHVNFCSGARFNSVSLGCVSHDCKLDLVDIKENLYAKKYAEEIFVPP